MTNYLPQIQKYVTNLFQNSSTEHLFFHSLNHTKDVVEAAIEISLNSNITEIELNIVIVSAWFHDCGYLKGYIEHEEESQNIAETFLKKINCEHEFIQKVKLSIDSTKYNNVPATLTEKIICDADMYHLCKPNYPIYEEMLKRELEINQGLIFIDKEWQRQNYEFFKNYHYYTHYGQTVLNKFKKINLTFVKEKMQASTAY